MRAWNGEVLTWTELRSPLYLPYPRFLANNKTPLKMKVWNGEDKGFELRSPLYPPRPHFLANNKTPLKMKVWNGEGVSPPSPSPIIIKLPTNANRIQKTQKPTSPTFVRETPKKKDGPGSFSLSGPLHQFAYERNFKLNTPKQHRK
ncbi:hypothetical protein JR316_0005709, partial [Psilocybe cubensis]